MKNFVFIILLLITFLSMHAQMISPATGNNVSASLTGEWEVVEQTISPLIIIPLCKPIVKGTTFKFTENELEVFVGTSGKRCDVFTYKVANNTLSFIKMNMIWLCNYELNKNQLKLISNDFFTPYKPDESLPVNKQSANQEVVVTLTKTN